MRVCIEKSTNKIIESQSGGEEHPDAKVDNEEYAIRNLEVLLQNAIARGYAAEDVGVFFEDDKDFATRLSSHIESEKSYADKRKEAYPSQTECLDGRVKQHSSDPAIVAEGIAQEMQYYSDCLQVKVDIPKE